MTRDQLAAMVGRVVWWPSLTTPLLLVEVGPAEYFGRVIVMGRRWVTALDDWGSIHSVEVPLDRVEDWDHWSGHKGRRRRETQR